MSTYNCSPQLFKLVDYMIKFYNLSESMTEIVIEQGEKHIMDTVWCNMRPNLRMFLLTNFKINKDSTRTNEVLLKELHDMGWIDLGDNSIVVEKVIEDFLNDPIRTAERLYC